VSADPFVSGALAAELLQLTVRGSGTVAVFTGDLSTMDHSEKVRGFKHGLDSLDGSLEASSIAETHDDERAAFNETRKLLSRDRTLKGIYVSTANSMTVVQALEELDPEHHITLITTDLFPELVPYIKSGRVLATLYQRPEAQGRMAFEALYKFLVEGKCPPHRLKLNPHIVMRSNLDLFTDRIAATTQASHHERVAQAL
jgi:LacI family transcriptional regulator